MEFPASRAMSSELLFFLSHPVFLLKRPEQTKAQGLLGSCRFRLESLSPVWQFLNLPVSVSSRKAGCHPRCCCAPVSDHLHHQETLDHGVCVRPLHERDWSRGRHRPRRHASAENTHGHVFVTVISGTPLCVQQLHRVSQTPDGDRVNRCHLTACATIPLADVTSVWTSSGWNSQKGQWSERAPVGDCRWLQPPK